MFYKTTSCQIAQNVGKSVEWPELGVGICYCVWTDPRFSSEVMQTAGVGSSTEMPVTLSSFTTTVCPSFLDNDAENDLQSNVR